MIKDLPELQKAAQEMRLNVLRLANRVGGKGAHIAPSLSEIDILAALYLSVMDMDRDCFTLSKGHGALGFYTALHQAGLISQDQLDTFENDGGDFPGQPSKNIAAGIEFSSGSLGMGLSYAAGRALAEKLSGGSGRFFVLLGDGECNEGSVWEAAMFASANHLDNLIAVVDQNGMQSDGMTDSVLPCDLRAIWSACSWEVAEADGHDFEQLETAFSTVHLGRPLVVLAKTIKGKGVSFMENNVRWHHARLSDTDYEKAVLEVSGG